MLAVDKEGPLSWPWRTTLPEIGVRYLDGTIVWGAMFVGDLMIAWEFTGTLILAVEKQPEVHRVELPWA